MSNKEIKYSSQTMQMLAGMNRKQRRRLQAILRPHLKKHGEVIVKTKNEMIEASKTAVPDMRPD